MFSEYDEATYGNQIADVYDNWHPGAPPEMIAALRDLAGEGPVAGFEETQQRAADE